MSDPYNIPHPYDICINFLNPYIQSLNLGTPATQVIMNVCTNLANDSITLNELFNTIYFAYPVIQKFMEDNALLSFTNRTFTDYTKTWLPYQMGVIIAIIVIVFLFLTLAGVIDYPAAIMMAIGSSAFLAVIGVLEANQLDTFVNQKETEFDVLIAKTLSALAASLGQQGFLGYVAASQLSINNGVGGYITLKDPAVVQDINPPYQKLLLINTSGAGGGTSDIYSFRLIVGSATPTNTQNVHLQNASLVYIMNINPYTNGTYYPPFATNDPTSIINLVNAYTVTGADGQTIRNFPKWPFPPPSSGNGVFIYPGECKAFINTGVNYLPVLGNAYVAFDTWVEVTSDIRPFSHVTQLTSSGSFMPIHRVEYLVCSSGITVTINNNYAYNGQELIMVANITPTSGSITVSDGISTSYTLTNSQRLILQYNIQSSKSWILIYQG